MRGPSKDKSEVGAKKCLGSSIECKHPANFGKIPHDLAEPISGVRFPYHLLNNTAHCAPSGSQLPIKPDRMKSGLQRLREWEPPNVFTCLGGKDQAPIQAPLTQRIWEL